MRVRLIGAIRQMNPKDPLLGLWLEPVVFPMAVINYEATCPTDHDELVLYSESELIAWAEDAFGEGCYEIFDVAVPTPATASPGLAREHPLLHLIREKKGEYEQAAISSEQSRFEIEAVIAALNTLLTMPGRSWRRTPPLTPEAARAQPFARTRTPNSSRRCIWQPRCTPATC